MIKLVLEKYLPDLEHLDMTYEDKMEMLKALELVVVSFIEYRDHEDPVSLALRERERDKAA